MLVTAAVFYLFAFILVFAATMVIAARNPVHSVLFLILSFFSAAGLFLLAGAEFVAFILMIVYVGAVAVLFLFVVMMLDIDGASIKRSISRSAPIGLAVGVALAVQLAALDAAWVTDAHVFADTGTAAPMMAGLSNSQALGTLLYTRYFYAFQLAGLVLLVAMIGAIVLTHRVRSGVRRQNINHQIGTTAAQVLEVRDVRVGEGVKL